MHHGCLLIFACAALAAAGCAAVAPPGDGLTGERTARITGVAGPAGPGARPEVIPVEHVFELINTGSEPVVIVAGRARINTVWRFADTGDAALPRAVPAGDTLPVAVTAKVRRREGAQQFFVELQLATGEVVRLDLLVDG